MNGRLFLAIGMSIFLFSCHQSAGDKTGYAPMLRLIYNNSVTVIHPEEINLHKDIFLDTRSLEEFNASHLDKAMWVGFDDSTMFRIPDSLINEPIILYCAVGYRSEKVGEQLLERDFKDISNLYGGVFHWSNQGRKVVNNEGELTDKVHGYSPWWGYWLKNAAVVY